MKRPILSTTFVLVLSMFVGGGSLQPAEAGDWYIGGGFRVGGVHFSLAFDRGHRHHDPYYYRTHHRVSYDGYRCGSYCLKSSGYVYHHASCPLVRHHFRRYDFHPVGAWDHFRGPRYDDRYDPGRHHGHRDYGWRGRGHRDYGQYDRGHRDYRRHDRGHRYDYRSRHRDHDRRYCPYR